MEGDGESSQVCPSLGLIFPPPAAIRRDPEAFEKLEATMLRLRRDQKGSGQEGRGWTMTDVSGVANRQI